MQLQGYLRNTNTRTTNPSKKTGKTYTIYQGEIHADNGQKFAVEFGFDKPDVTNGDYISLDAFEERGVLKVDQSTIVRREPPKAAAAPQQPATGGSNSGGGDSASGQSSSGNYAPREYGYKTNPEDARRITYAASNDRALKTLDFLVRNDALPHSKAKGKGGEAQRYQEFMAALDKLTVKFFNDAMSLRVLEVVADEGVIDTSPSSTLPEDEPKKPAASSLDD